MSARSQPAAFGHHVCQCGKDRVGWRSRGSISSPIKADVACCPIQSEEPPFRRFILNGYCIVLATQVPSTNLFNDEWSPQLKACCSSFGDLPDHDQTQCLQCARCTEPGLVTKFSTTGHHLNRSVYGDFLILGTPKMVDSLLQIVNIG